MRSKATGAIATTSRAACLKARRFRLTTAGVSPPRRSSAAWRSRPRAFSTIKRRFISAIEEAALESNRITSILATAARWGERLRSAQQEVLATLIDRVELRPDGMRVLLKLPLSSPAEGVSDDGSSHLSIARQFPMRLRRRGVELRLVVDGDRGLSRKTDRALLSAVARAHCWFGDLVSARCGSMTEIARRERVGKQYVSRLIRLAFLAPAIVEQIAEGRQPPELTAQALLTGRLNLPVVWEAQRQTLEFARSA